MSKGSTSTSTTSVPAWENSDWQSLIGQSNNVTNQAINSENIPGVQNQINSSSTGILGNQVNPQGLAAPITNAAGASWTTPGTAQSFMSPYENTALENQIGIEQQSLLAPELAGVNQTAAASGALGGSRSQVLQGLDTENFNNTLANTVAQGENTAYNTGLSAYESEAARNLAGQEAGAQTQLQGANQNVNTNLAASQNALTGIAAGEAPEQQINSEAGILAALPNQSTTQTTQTPNGGALGGALGGILGGTGQLLSGIAAFSKGGIADGMPIKRKKTRRLKKKKKNK